MDVNDLRIAVTVVSLLTFVGLLVWVGLRRNRAAFDEAARIPFAADDGAEKVSS
jgi:cytochrome c oxidase cbb3-type subunit 4